MLDWRGKADIFFIVLQADSVARELVVDMAHLTLLSLSLGHRICDVARVVARRQEEIDGEPVCAKVVEQVHYVVED